METIKSKDLNLFFEHGKLSETGLPSPKMPYILTCLNLPKRYKSNLTGKKKKIVSVGFDYANLVAENTRHNTDYSG